MINNINNKKRFGILLLSLFILVSMGFVIAQFSTSYPSYNTGYSSNYYDRGYSRSYYDSRLGSGYSGYNSRYTSSNYDSRFNDPYYDRYSTSYSNKYPDYYNRYDSGYNIYGSSVNPQFYPPGYSGFRYESPGQYWSDYGNERCIGNQDLILMITPGGCSPAVVRSDLLEEQNVPVFCKISAIQVNPLIDISRIRSVRVKGQYPKGVSGVSYFPSRAALRSSNFRGEITGSTANPVYNDDIGYLVIVLSRQQNETAMPEYVQGNITAIVDYRSESAFGIGDTNFYLTEMSDEEWSQNYQDYSFWNGRGHVRVESIDQNSATVSIYRDADSRQGTVTIREGQTSKDIFLSGFYCAAGMRVRVEKIGYPVDSALLQINDEQIWVAEGDRILDRRCRVVDLDTSAGGGKVTLRCSGSDKGLIELSLNPGKVVYKINGEYKEFMIGDEIIPNIFLSYVGKDSDNRRYAVLVKDGFSDTKNEFADKDIYDLIENEVGEREKLGDLEDRLDKKIREHYVSKFKFDKEEVDSEVVVEVVEEGECSGNICLDEVLVARDDVLDYEMIGEGQILAKENYDKSIAEYEELYDLYPNEKMEFVEEDPYAAKGLLEAAQLSRKFGMDEKAHEFYDRLMSEYPDSNSARDAEIKEKYLMKYDTSNAKTSFRIMNELYFVDLLDFKRPSQKEASAVVLVDGKEKIWGLNEVNVIRKDDFTHSFKITRMDDEYIDIEYEKTGGERTETKKKRLSLRDRQDSFSGVDVKLVNINLKKQVKLSILSAGYGPRTESNFNFKVGIEKRAIQISTEQAKDMMNSILGSMEKWQEINEKLSSVVKVMKGACFATSTLLTIKNMMDGSNAESMVRGIIMKNSGGWNDKCEDMVDKGTYSSVHECLLANKDSVNKDIEIYGNEVDRTNDILRRIGDRHVTDGGGIFGGRTVDSKKVEEEFKQEFEGWCKSQSGSVDLPGREKTKVVLGDSDKSVCNWEALTHEQRRDIMTLHNVQKAGGSEILRNVTGRELGSTLLNAKNYHDEFEERERADRDAENKNLGIKTTDPEGDSVTHGYIKTIGVSDLEHEIYGKIGAEKSVVRVFIPSEKNLGESTGFKLGEGLSEEERERVVREIGGKQVIVEIEYSSDDNYYIPKSNGKVFLVDGTLVSDEGSREVRRYMEVVGLNKIRKSDKKAYENKMKAPERLKVKYFENAPYKGLPAEVPFDIENGWYVEMTYVLSGVGKPYDASGRVVNFYICNVGPNGLIEFKKSADDICRYYNTETGADLNFPGMSSSESSRLIAKAKSAIQQAAKQYGKSKVNINGKNFDTGSSYGGGEGRCTDFMSIDDCTLLFNVCDPVICPASRCDYGGKYRVDNVIQTGIVGSLLLCLPNYKEGVAVPICLTGVHAGLDNYLSILNSSVQCLNESIETGRNIGICDEIKSIYLCDLFWKQAAPLAELIVPSLFGLTGGTRGGGEYLTAKNAWENTKGAMNYFTENYAVNSFKSFSSRSIENAYIDIGAEVCKVFLSSGFDSQGLLNLFDTLIEPDSPVQYSAWFDEHKMSDATVPPTSHYKVYYHIYAGKDIGAHYVVYLKNLNVDTSFHTSGHYVVDRGYVNRGGQVDRARDFVAVSGYKQLCISVNGQEECGFGKVSTSYLVNSLTDEYVQEQVGEQVRTEEECIAGTPSLKNAFQFNIQASVEEMIKPELYNHGIIRVCSSENPGKQVLPSGEYDRTNSTYDKWKAVGYCDDPTIKCWLDTSSVREVVKDKGVEDQILDKVDRDYIRRENYWTYERSRSVGDRAEDFIVNDLEELVNKDSTKESVRGIIREVVIDLTKLTELGITNVHRARGHYLIGRLYKVVAEKLWEVSDEGVVELGGEMEGEDGESRLPGLEEGDEVPGYAEDSGFRIDSENRIYMIVNGKKVYTDYYIKKDGEKYIIYEREGDNRVSDWVYWDKEVGRIENKKVKITGKGNTILNRLDGLYFSNGKFFREVDEDEEIGDEVIDDREMVESEHYDKLEFRIISYPFRPYSNRKYDYYYKYDKGWKWSFDNKKWGDSISEESISSLSDEDKEFVFLILNENFMGGLELIHKRCSDNKEELEVSLGNNILEFPVMKDISFDFLLEEIRRLIRSVYGPSGPEKIAEDCKKIEVFVNNLKERVNKAWKSKWVSVYFSGMLSSETEFVCFVDLSSEFKGPAAEVWDEIIYKDKEANMFFYPIEESCDMSYHFIEHLDINEITSNENPYCISVEEGRVRFKVLKEPGEEFVRVGRE